MNDGKIPILTYHSIDPSGSVISTSPGRFQSQMKWLADNGYRTISLVHASENIRTGTSFPEKSFVLTFDDGCENFYSTAFPVLKDCNFTATVFIVTGRCGMDNQWEEQPEEIPVLKLMDWKQIEELSSRGIDFGSHSVNHFDLTRIDAEAARQEIRNSKTALEQRLKMTPVFFAYPYGCVNEAIRNIVQEEYAGACSTEMAMLSQGSDLFSLPRLEMYYFSQNDYLFWMGRSKFLYYVRSRAFLRSIRTSTQSFL